MNYKIGHSHPSVISSYKERSQTHNPLEISENAVNSKLQYEAARKHIPYRYLKFFEYVVLDNMTLSEANKISLRSTNKKAPFKKFKECLNILAYHYGYVR